MLPHYPTHQYLLTDILLGGHTTKGALGIPLGLTSICLLLELEATVDIFDRYSW